MSPILQLENFLRNFPPLRIARDFSSANGNPALFSQFGKQQPLNRPENPAISSSANKSRSTRKFLYSVINFSKNWLNVNSLGHNIRQCKFQQIGTCGKNVVEI